MHHVFALVREVSGHRQRHVSADTDEAYGLVFPHDRINCSVLRLGVVLEPLGNLRTRFT